MPAAGDVLSPSLLRWVLLLLVLLVLVVLLEVLVELAGELFKSPRLPGEVATAAQGRGSGAGEWVEARLLAYLASVVVLVVLVLLEG